MREMWPTPSVCGDHNRKGASKTSGDGLATAITKASCRASCNDSLSEMPCERTYEDWNLGKIPRIATNIPNRVDRLKAIGNGQVPNVVKTAWEILSDQEKNEK